MAHNRKLVLGGVSLTDAPLDVPIHEVASEVRDEVESIMITARYFDGAPFSWVSLILNFGLNDDDAPSYGRVNAKHGDLPISIEMDVRRIEIAGHRELYFIVKRAVLKALIHVGVKHRLPIELLEQELDLIESSD